MVQYGNLELPANFQKQLLDCEIDRYLNEKIEPSLIRKLIELYAAGLEYYESIQSYKYVYFKKKMEEIIRSPTIIKEMNVTSEVKQQKSVVLTKSQQKRKIESLHIKQKQQKLANQLININSGLTAEKIKNIIYQNDQKTYETQQIIRGQISQQQNKIRLKLERRKIKKQYRKSLSSITLISQKSTNQTLLENQQNEDEKSQNSINVDFSQIINQDNEDQDNSTIIK